MSGDGVRFEVHHQVDPFPTRDVALLLGEGNLLVWCAACHREHHHAEGITATCEVCGEVFPINPAQAKKRRFCSLACRDLHPDFAPMTPRPCANCNRQYQPTRTEQVYCSQACNAAGVGKRKRAARPSFTCRCGRVFTVPPSHAARPRKAAPTCSNACKGLDRVKHPKSLSCAKSPPHCERALVQLPFVATKLR